MPTELFANNVASTLAADTTNVATTLTVASSTGFPAAATGVSQFRAIVGTELLVVTNVTGVTWTVTRGAEGSVAAAHTSGDAVTHVVTAGSLANGFDVVGAAAAETTRATTAEGLLAPKASPTFTGTVSGVTKTHVGLANVDNTADTAKPVSTAQQAALNLKARLTVLNVKDYGALGDLTTDDSAAIQAAIDACDPNRGGTVYFPQGRYRVATGLTVTYQGTVLAGEGQSGFGSGAQGSSRIVSDNAITAITFNPGATPAHGTLAYGIRDLHVKGAAASTTGNGIVVQNAEGFKLTNVAVSDYIGGTGLLIDGKTGNSQYASLVNISGGDCLTVIKTQGTGPNGLRIFGAHLDSANTTPRASSIGIHLSTGDTSRIFGAVVQGYATGIYVQASAVGHEIFGGRFEYSNIGIRLGAAVSKFTLFGGSFNNNLLGGGGTSIGIQVDAGASGVILMPTAFGSLATNISDAGTGTVYPFTAAGGGWTAVDASETVKGIAELATQVETDTGTDDLRIVTPLKLQTRLAAFAQPLDSDLTALAALATTAFGRGFLDLADAAAGRTKLGLGTAALSASGDFQPIDSDLTAIAALTTTATGRSLLAGVDAAALRTILALGTAATVNTGTASGDLPLLSTGGVLPIARLATGTPDGTKYIRDDGALVTPSGGGGSGMVAPLAPRVNEYATTLGLAAGGNVQFPTSGIMWGFAIPLAAGTYDQIVLEVNIAGTAGCFLRLGVYDDDALLSDFGTVAASTTGVKTVTGSVVISTAKVYIVTGVLQTVLTTAVGVVKRSLSAGWGPVTATTALNSQPATGMSWSYSGAESGALPASLTAKTKVQLADGAAVLMRRSA